MKSLSESELAVFESPPGFGSLLAMRRGRHEIPSPNRRGGERFDLQLDLGRCVGPRRRRAAGSADPRLGLGGTSGVPPILKVSG